MDEYNIRPLEKGNHPATTAAFDPPLQQQQVPHAALGAPSRSEDFLGPALDLTLFPELPVGRTETGRPE